VDLFWRRADGRQMTEADWTDPAQRHIAVEMRMAEGTPPYVLAEEALFAVFNVGDGFSVTLPEPPSGQAWVRHLDTARPGAKPSPTRGDRAPVIANSVVVFVLEPGPPPPTPPSPPGSVPS
jgi:glycogen operon protein